MGRLFHLLDLTYIHTSLISFVAQCKRDVTLCMQYRKKEMSACKGKIQYEIWSCTCPVDSLVLENNMDQETDIESRKITQEGFLDIGLCTHTPDCLRWLHNRRFVFILFQWYICLVGFNIFFSSFRWDGGEFRRKSERRTERRNFLQMEWWQRNIR